MPFFEDLKIITLFSLGFFALFLFNYKKGNRKSNVILACIYAFQSMEMLNGTFYRFWDFWVSEFPWVFYSTEFTFFLWGPAIYFFFMSSVDKEHVFEKRDYWHLIPAVLHFVFLCVTFHFYSNSTKSLLLKEGVMSPAEDFIIHFLKNGSLLVYLFLSTKLFRQSNIESDIKKRWLVFFLTVFWVVAFIQIFHFVDLETRIYNTIIYNTTTIVWFSVAIMTLYKALRDPFFFTNEKEQKPELKVERKDQLQLVDEEYENILNRLNEDLIKNEGFVNPDLNLKVLSNEIGFPPKKVSFVINDHFKQSISDFINSFRVEKAKKILNDSDEVDRTIIEIAYEVGFNSKATFNRAFAKFTGVSPTEFKKQLNNKEV